MLDILHLIIDLAKVFSSLVAWDGEHKPPQMYSLKKANDARQYPINNLLK